MDINLTFLLHPNELKTQQNKKKKTIKLSKYLLNIMSQCIAKKYETENLNLRYYCLQIQLMLLYLLQ